MCALLQKTRTQQIKRRERISPGLQGQLLSLSYYFSTDKTLYLLRETRSCFCQARNCRDLLKRQFPPPLPLTKEFPQEKVSSPPPVKYYKPSHPHCIQIPPCYHGERRSSSSPSQISIINPSSAPMHALLRRKQNGQQDKIGEKKSLFLAEFLHMSPCPQQLSRSRAVLGVSSICSCIRHY